MIHLATTAEDAESLRLLSRGGADLNRVDPMGRSNLHLATSQGSLPLVTALLAGGAQVNFPDPLEGQGHLPAQLYGQRSGPRPPLQRAVELSLEAVVAQLLQAKADVATTIETRELVTQKPLGRIDSALTPQDVAAAASTARGEPGRQQAGRSLPKAWLSCGLAGHGGHASHAGIEDQGGRGDMSRQSYQPFECYWRAFLAPAARYSSRSSCSHARCAGQRSVQEHIETAYVAVCKRAKTVAGLDEDADLALTQARQRLSSEVAFLTQLLVENSDKTHEIP